MDAADPEPWYRDGLAFECTGCGACCTGEPGYVWVEAGEAARIAAALQMSEDQFSRSYLRQVGDRCSLIEYPNGDCVFLRADHSCAIYANRPEQCRTYPFWPEIVASPASWRKAARRCEGIGRASIVPLETIRAAAERMREARL